MDFSEDYPTTNGYNGVGVTVDSPLTSYLSTLPHHDRETLLSILEVAKGGLVFEDCKERDLYSGLCLALWRMIKAEEVGE